MPSRNGISLTHCFTSPDIDEANVKGIAVRQSYVTKARVITDSLPNEKYREQCVIKEVMK